jgi:hypothetical protein
MDLLVICRLLFFMFVTIVFFSVCVDYDTLLSTQDRILKQISFRRRQNIYVHVDLQGFILMALSTFLVSADTSPADIDTCVLRPLAIDLLFVVSFG